MVYCRLVYTRPGPYSCNERVTMTLKMIVLNETESFENLKDDLFFVDYFERHLDLYISF